MSAESYYRGCFKPSEVWPAAEFDGVYADGMTRRESLRNQACAYLVRATDCPGTRAPWGMLPTERLRRCAQDFMDRPQYTPRREIRALPGFDPSQVGLHGIGNYSRTGGIRGLGEDVVPVAPVPPPAVMGVALGIVPMLGIGLAIWAALNWDKWNRRSHA